MAGMSLASGVVIGPFHVIAGAQDVVIDLYNPSGATRVYAGAAITLISVDVAERT